jgi:hypothetical protein
MLFKVFSTRGGLKMKEILEGMRGPVLGLIVMIIALAGIVTTAAFAALIAQISLFLRLRSRKNQPRQAGSPAVEPHRSALSTLSRSPKDSVYEPRQEDVVDAVWWQEVR